ncbi:hypothetical protein PVAND_012253 [Polypedilum vanderplanki]|uniref:Serine/threonine-protein kinase receptor n=1 Tax=Polypedilum vanderplanki TaxID=319348 RepID=A0A9J6CM58_POLVA|nr:hypothetical protein PVAND_012253 [Polypedilum vanderplanki]
MLTRILLLFLFLTIFVSDAAAFNDDLDHNEDENYDSFHPDLVITCKYFKRKDCQEKGLCKEENKKCPAPNDKRQGCFVLWKHDNITNENYVEMKDCFIFHENCEQNECYDTDYNKTNENYFCCCRHDMCNEKFEYKPVFKETTTIINEDSSVIIDTETDTPKWILACILILSLIGFCFAFKYIYHRKKGLFNEIPTMDPEISISSQCLAIRPIDLIEIKAHGRFGTVWRGKMKTDDVAVKIFPTQDKNSWIAEQEIYKLPRMNHSNILHFIGAEKHIYQEGKTEFWLITEYQPIGSLCDYLKSHTVTWSELCKIAESMARGLMHLHEEIPGNRNDLKPAIAHRDFKSKNVLLKSDLTACIADFGLALVFNPGQPCGDVHGQVGTRRYMAPEILEGAINFNRDSFLRIDVYACGLVLWELVSRCTCHGGPVAEYQLPFENELGSHPTLEEMQENIAAKKLRPKLYDEWRNHNGLSAIIDTIEECWDHDAEARLSSSCIMERISQHSRYQTITIDQTTNFISRNNANDQ